MLALCARPRSGLPPNIEDHLRGSLGWVTGAQPILVARPGKQKRSKQLKGKVTEPMKMLLVGMVELFKTTMTETGRVHSRLVRNHSGETLEHLIRSAGRPGLFQIRRSSSCPT